MRPFVSWPEGATISARQYWCQMANYGKSEYIYVSEESVQAEKRDECMDHG